MHRVSPWGLNGWNYISLLILKLTLFTIMFFSLQSSLSLAVLAHCCVSGRYPQQLLNESGTVWNHHHALLPVFLHKIQTRGPTQEDIIHKIDFFFTFIYNYLCMCVVSSMLLLYFHCNSTILLALALLKLWLVSCFSNRANSRHWAKHSTYFKNKW